MNFKKWVKNIQTEGYNGACTVFGTPGQIITDTIYRAGFGS